MKVVAIICAVMEVLSLVSFAGGLDRWHLRNPEWVPNPFLSVCYGGNRFVAAGANGMILTSTDGSNWVDTSYSPSSSSTNGSNWADASISSTVYANGQFFGVGHGFVLSSTNGSIWEYTISSNVPPFVAMSYGNGVFVGIYGSGDIYSSTNGLDWQYRHRILGSSGLNAIAFGVGRFVAVGYAGDSATSTNGIDWTNGGIGSGYSLYGIAFGNGRFITGGQVDTYSISSDGIHWTNQSPSLGYFFLTHATFGNGRFVISGFQGPNRVLLTSTDGVSWAGTIASPHNSTALASGNGIDVAVSDDSTILYSRNSVFWNQVGSDSRENLAGGIVCGNGRFVAVAKNALTSSDGTQWTNVPIPLASLRNGIGFGNGTFVAVGDGNPITTSPDGINWNIFYPTGGSGFHSVAYGNDRFVVGGAANALTSTDGQTWIQQSTGYIGQVAFGNGLFVSPNGASVRTSIDGANWTPPTALPAGNSANAVAFGNGIFVTVGDQGLILSSTDGTNWLQRDAGTTIPLTSVAFGDGTFIATSWDWNYRGLIFTSNDGISWQQRDTGVRLRLFSASYGNNSFVLVGENGLVLQSDPLADLRIQKQNTQIRLDVSCDTGNGCFLQSSTNLQTWENLISTNIHGQLSWFETITTNSPQRFYRLVPP
jgi:hypothetical protein